MNTILQNVPEDKLNRIINACLEEFAHLGYDNASTNTIVERAGISKGLLYHYFGSKEKLYKLIEEYSVEIAYKSLVDKIDWSVTDIYMRIRQYCKVKVEIAKKHPYIFEFIKNMKYQKGEEKMREYIASISPTIFDNMMTYNVDFTKFEDSINIKYSINIIQWTIEKYVDDAIEDIIHLGSCDEDKVWKNVDEYIGILKRAFYKPAFKV